MERGLIIMKDIPGVKTSVGFESVDDGVKRFDPVRCNPGPLFKSCEDILADGGQGTNYKTFEEYKQRPEGETLRNTVKKSKL
jgi:hypothetical protein